MVGPVFVCDAKGTPLMPTAPAYARKLLRQSKAVWQPHHAFPVIRLTHNVEQPTLRPIVAGIDIQLDSARLVLLADAQPAPVVMLTITVDLRTDLVWRLRRRAEHRRRRRARGRFRGIKLHGIPFTRRRPSMLRSTWRHQHPRRTSRAQLGRTAPIMAWRAEAILRTLAALQQLLPISNVVLLNPTGQTFYVETEPSLRQRLVEAYGRIVDGQRVPRCAYCSTTIGTFVVDHVLPQSRGGTDAWNNVVLACTRCNDRKGDHTPEEAGMILNREPQTARSNRAGVYRKATQSELIRKLRRTPLAIHSLIEQDSAMTALIAFFQSPVPPTTASFIAKPISRRAKQRYTARNYPLTTPLKAGWERHGSTVKRRTRVNAALQVERRGQKNVVTVITASAASQHTSGSVVRVGMLCEGKRADQHVVGIVVAIETTGRLRLLVPQTLQGTRVRWKRMLISPRQHLCILANEPIVFFRTPQGDQQEPVTYG